VPVLLAPISSALNLICTETAISSSHFEFTAALICGNDLQNSDLKSLLVNVGLYHLIVVSCSHLNFFEALTQKLPLKES
jgi:predicted membrane metal-binding protein